MTALGSSTPAAIGTCCLAADRRRVRVPELAASVLMLLAMLDSSLGVLVAPVLWAVLLLAAAMALAVIRRARVPRPPRASGRAMTLHTAIGMVAMAALLLAMGHADAAESAHSHGVSAGALTVVFLLGVGGYAVASVAAATRAHGWLDRTQYVAMGLSTLVMGAALTG